MANVSGLVSRTSHGASQMIYPKTHAAAGALFFGLAAFGQASANEVEDFYRGKTLQFIVGSAAGSGYDLTSRPLGKYLTKYLPGHPLVIIRNMPGAAAVIMTNYFVGAAPADGTVIGMGTSNVPYEPRLKLMSADGKNSNWDPRSLSWIGTPVREPQISWVWGASGIETWKDMRDKPTRFGSTTIGGDNSIFPLLANKLLGLKSEVITGYQGSSEVFLAIERGELNASNTAYSNLTIQKPDWLKSGRARIVMQFGIERIPSLPDVPSLIELVQNDEDRKMLRFLLMKFEMHRPIYGPPKIPKDRLEALRKSFDQAVTDPDFVDEATKMGLELRPLSGLAITKMIDEIMETPEPLVARVRDTINALAN